MKTKQWFYLMVVAVGMDGMASLTVWDVVQVRKAAVVKNQRWVSSVSETLSSERQSLTQWLNHFAIKSATFRDIADSRPDVAALAILDLKRHDSKHWTRRGLESLLEPLDPRLGVLQLQTLTSQTTLPGPIVFTKGKPYFTVVRPVSRSRVLVAFLEAARVWEDMQKDAAVWHMRVSIYDYEKHPLFGDSVLRVSLVRDFMRNEI